MTGTTTSKPVRAGVFNTVRQADQAVRNLLAAGFSKDQLAVVCSDVYKEQFFKDLKTLDYSGSHTPEGVAAGGVVGLAIGGLAALVTANPILLAIGVVGPFVGAMMTRGFEKEITDFYDQALQRGLILIAVEIKGEGNLARLDEAERIFNEAGSEGMPLTE